MEVVYPEDEAERLLELRRYEVGADRDGEIDSEMQILDTAPEPEFDRITTLLKRVLGTTLATIVLVDRDRHWVKSCCVTDLVGVSVPRGGFCSRTILSNQIHMVTDAHLVNFSDLSLRFTLGSSPWGRNMVYHSTQEHHSQRRMEGG